MAGNDLPMVFAFFPRHGVAADDPFNAFPAGSFPPTPGNVYGSFRVAYPDFYLYIAFHGVHILGYWGVGTLKSYELKVKI